MSRAELGISTEMLRQLLDLPDAIRITGFGNDWLALTQPVPPRTLVIAVESDHEFHADEILPTYRRHVDEGITRVELVEIQGYQGPLEPRPSTRRRQ